MIIKRIVNFNKIALKDLNLLLLQLSSRGYQMNVKQFKKVLKNKNTHVMALYDGKSIIGTATLVNIDQITGNKGYVEDVVVDEKHRGHGLGTKLLLDIISRAKKLKIFRLELKSELYRMAGNNLYQKLGFKKIEANVYQLKL